MRKLFSMVLVLSIVFSSFSLSTAKAASNQRSGKFQMIRETTGVVIQL